MSECNDTCKYYKNCWSRGEYLKEDGEECVNYEPERPHVECKTCKHFVRGGLDGKTYVCEHPKIELDDQFVYACIMMNENDFCSRYEPEEGEVK